MRAERAAAAAPPAFLRVIARRHAAPRRDRAMVAPRLADVKRARGTGTRPRLGRTEPTATSEYGLSAAHPPR